MAVLNPEVNTQHAKEQTKTPAEETQVKAQEPAAQKTEQDTEQKKKDIEEDPNWRAFREARKKDRIEKEAAERKAAEREAEVIALKAAMEAAFSKSAPSPQAYQQYYGTAPADEEETEEQRIEKKVRAIIDEKERQYAKEQQDRELKEYPTKLSRDFPDFKTVCSQENLDYLDFHYPEISRPLQRLGDGYDKWHDIYYAVKKLIPGHSTARKDASMAESNSMKPRSSSTANLSPPGEITRQTWQDQEQRRAENWARMQRTLKGV